MGRSQVKSLTSMPKDVAVARTGAFRQGLERRRIVSRLVAAQEVHAYTAWRAVAIHRMHDRRDDAWRDLDRLGTPHLKGLGHELVPNRQCQFATRGIAVDLRVLVGADPDDGG